MKNNMSQSSVVGRTYPLGSCGVRTPKGTKHKLASLRQFKEEQGDLWVQRRNPSATTVRVEHFSYFRFLNTQNSGFPA